MMVSFIGGGNRRKPPTCRKSLTNFITYRVHPTILGIQAHKGEIPNPP